MKKEFLLNLAFLVAINLLVKPLYIFGIDVQVQNTVGADYGTFFALVNFAYLMQFIADFGIQQYNNRAIAQKEDEISHLFPQLMMTKLLLVIPYILVAYFFAWIIGLTEDWFLLIIVLINQLFISISMFIRSNVSGLGMYRKDSILSIMDKLVMILFCGFLLLNPATKSAFTIHTFAFAQMASFIVVIGLGIWFIRGKKLFENFNWSFNKIRPLIKKSIPFGITVLLMTLYTRIDAVMIKTLLANGAEEAQVYAGGYRLLDAANMLAFLFAPLLLPMFSKLYKQPKELQQLFKLSTSLMWVIIISASIPCWVYRQEIMDLLYTESDPYWGSVFGALILNFIWTGLIIIFVTFITAKGEMKKANIVFTICIILNIIFNFLLIPELKAWGAAITTLITHGAAAIGLVFLIREVLFHRSMWRTLGLAFVFSGGAVGLIWGIQQFDIFHWIIRFILSISSCILLSFLIKLLDIHLILKDLKTLRS